MPYSSTSRLPVSVRNTLPKHAQAIYRKAFENAWEEYKAPDKRRGRTSREEAAHKVAWSAVKTKYKKNGDKWSSRSSDDNGSAKSSPRKTPAKLAKSAKPTTVGGAKKSAARKSPVKAQVKSASTKKKTAAKSSGADARQARWKTAAAQKTKSERRSRGKTAAAGSRTGASRQQKSRKSTESSTKRRQARQAQKPAAGIASSGQQPEQVMSQQQPEQAPVQQGNTGNVS